ncbi:MAG: hypothetical protein R6X34_09125 [Chloroflexota bacterium]
MTGLCTSFYLLLALLLAGGAAPEPPPDDLYGSGGECLPAQTPSEDSGLAFSAAPRCNESLDLADQRLLAAAIGDDALALAWLTAGETRQLRLAFPHPGPTTPFVLQIGQWLWGAGREVNKP